MKLVKLKNAVLPNLPDNEEPYASRHIPKQGIPLHHLGVFLGGTGSGKTMALKFLEWYGKAGSFDRLVVFSPTGMKDPKTKRFIQDDHYFDVTYYPKYADDIMREEAHNFEADIQEWEQFKKQKQAYEKYQRCKDVEDLTMEDSQYLHECDFEKPKWKYPKEQWPCFAVLIDDHACSKGVFGTSNKGYLSEFCVGHRHFSTSVYLLSQVFMGFVPKQFRGGIVNLWALFSTKSQHHKEEIAEQVANKVDEKTFIQCGVRHSQRNILVSTVSPCHFNNNGCRCELAHG